MFSAETVDSLRIPKEVEGVEEETGDGGDGVNKARRLVESPLIRCCLTAIGALGITVVASDVFSE